MKHSLVCAVRSDDGGCQDYEYAYLYLDAEQLDELQVRRDALVAQWRQDPKLYEMSYRTWGLNPIWCSAELLQRLTPLEDSENQRDLIAELEDDLWIPVWALEREELPWRQRTDVELLRLSIMGDVDEAAPPRVDIVWSCQPKHVDDCELRTVRVAFEDFLRLCREPLGPEGGRTAAADTPPGGEQSRQDDAGGAAGTAAAMARKVRDAISETGVFVTSHMDELIALLEQAVAEHLQDAAEPEAD